MNIHLDLSRFDGRNLDELESLKAVREHSSQLLGELVEITGRGDKNMQIGATWLLRAYLGEGARLSRVQLGHLVGPLPTLSDGCARLHICQVMREIEVPEQYRDAFASFFRACSKSEDTFVRAWAPDGFWQLANQYQQYEAEARALIEKSLADSRPSVRARARRILAEE